MPSARTVVVFGAALVYALMGIFPYLGSVLMAAPVGVAFLMASWGIGLIGVVLLARRRSLWTLAAPVIAGLYWAAVMAIGEQALGWTA
jgi:hypothetical protein